MEKAEKIWKKTLREQQNRLKPGECMKYVRMIIDETLTGRSLGQELILELKKTDLKHEARILPESNCIIWERSVGQRVLLPEIQTSSSSSLTNDWDPEPQVVKILSALELQRAVKDSTLELLYTRLQLAFPDMNYTVVVPKMQEKGEVIGNALIEMQIMYGVNIREIKTGTGDLLALLKCLTKAIAEAPFKQQKNEKLGSFKKYLANDKKQCVRVEGRCGFGRLWQQHLNRLPSVTLEVAESIISAYSCPKKLIDIYDENGSKAINSIADLRIQRSGPVALQTDRRIGQVLSQKLYTLYTARDPSTLL